MCFYLFFSPRYLRAALANCGEILHHVQKSLPFYNANKRFQRAFTQKILRGQKHAKFGTISDDFKLQPWISLEWRRYSKWDKYVIYCNSSRVWRKKSFELWSINYGGLAAKSYPPKLTFSGDNISAPKGCYTPQFLHALENNQVLLAHPPPGTRIPITIFYHRRFHIGTRQQSWTRPVAWELIFLTALWAGEGGAQLSQHTAQVSRMASSS